MRIWEENVECKVPWVWNKNVMRVSGTVIWFMVNFCVLRIQTCLQCILEFDWWYRLNEHDCIVNWDWFGVFGARVVMDVLGVGEGGNPWRMLRRRWSAAEFGELEKGCSRKWRILVKMKSRIEAMVWKVARGDEGER